LSISAKYSMHPRNRYRNGYDFQQLKAQSPELAQYFTVNHRGAPTIDFSNAQAVLALNRALLRDAYGIENWDIPPGYLCPAIPGRMDYLHAVADLLNGPARILDIGVGANCIFPIVGVCEYQWQFVGVDIDAQAIASAQKIIDANPRLQGQVELRLQTLFHLPLQAHLPQLQPGTRSPIPCILNGVIQTNDFFDAVICNPPFHASAEAVRLIEEQKWRNRGIAAVGSFGGQSNEMWCAGGELGFIQGLIDESENFQTQVNWFTCFISQASNVQPLRAQLEAKRNPRIEIIEMGQGQKRSRFLAWAWPQDCMV
jgi:23S rRNA (adenine1618-N6)-methyltransferase